MKKLFFIICIFYLILTPLFALTAEKEKDASGKVYSTLINEPSSDIIYIILSFKTGSVNDPKGKEGLSYITSAMIGEKIEKDLNEKAWASASQLFTTADKERTNFFFKVHRDNFKDVWPLFISNITSPVLNEDFLTIAKNSAANQMDYIINNGEYLSLYILESFIYQNHPYGTSEYGTESSIKNININDVKDFYKKYYIKENYEVSVSGDKVTYSKIKNELALLNTGRAEEKKIEKPADFKGIKILLIEQNTPSAAVSMGFPVDYTRGDDAYYSALMASSYFGYHRYMHGLLFTQLRNIRGFNYGDYSYADKFVEGGEDKMPATRHPRQKQYFYIWLRNMDERNVTFSIKFVLKNLEQLTKESLLEENFNETKNFLLNNSKLWAFDPFQKLGFSMDSDYYGIPYFPDYLEKKLKDLTEKKMSEDLKNNLYRGNIKIVIVTSNAGKMMSDLMINQSEPVYNSTIPEEAKKEDKEVMNYKLNLTSDNFEIITGNEIFK